MIQSHYGAWDSAPSRTNELAAPVRVLFRANALRWLALALFLFTTGGCATTTENERIAAALESHSIPFEVREDGVVVLVPDVLFQFDSAVLSGVALERVMLMTSVISQFDAERLVVIEGHTDSIGDPAYNLSLSTQRAQSVLNALVAEGLEPERLTASGLGSSRPLAPNRHVDGRDNPEGRQANRRVDVIIKNR